MIRVRFDGAQMTVSGHAGYAPAGRDIVCAAVSALVYALAGYLEETGQAERVTSAGASRTSGARRQARRRWHWCGAAWNSWRRRIPGAWR